MIIKGPGCSRSSWWLVLAVGFSLAGACSDNHTLRPDQQGGGGAGGYHPGGGNSGDGGDQGIGGYRSDGGAGGHDPGIGGGGGVLGIGGQVNIGGSPGIGGEQYGIGGQYNIGGAPGIGGQQYGIGGQVATGGTGGTYTPCAQEGTQAACDANTSCHSVFFDPHNCSCAGSGCCATFHHCADFDGAQCYGGVGCAVATPYCESPYVVAYSNGCYEGCVLRDQCAAVCTPGANQSCNDNPIVSSIHGTCTAAGACQCGTGFILNPNTGRCL